MIGYNDHADEVFFNYTVTPYNQVCGGYYTGSQDWIDCIAQFCFGDINGPEYAPYEITVSYVQIRDYPSDGLLCEYTQIVNGIPGENEYEAMGVNHFEEVNTGAGTTLNGNDEIYDRFFLIWERQDIFGTPVR